ncbi:hypothetical protein DFP72DRAFT_917172 [Ephemerocybe angulata]|uniref:Uncharacterized protein n=1 Tax=Ephemerocybe angulata TaxID=980116 RepID=A0A8H6LZ61_9AGAR|nr:hypothetical protein DFP72DRAFT_917172 [Tulosesus angulatus]
MGTPTTYTQSIYDHLFTAVGNAHEDAPGPLPPRCQSSTMAHVGKTRCRTGDGGNHLGKFTKNGGSTWGTQGECTRGVNGIPEANHVRTAPMGWYKPARPSALHGLVLRSKRPRALEKPESRAEVWIARLSIREPRGKHRDGAGGKATPSLERRWAVGGTDGGGVVGSRLVERSTYLNARSAELS